jgi:hexosaminidase
MKYLFYLLILFLFAGCIKTAEKQISIIPVPQEIIRHHGKSAFHLPLRITVNDPVFLPVAEVFRSNIKQILAVNSTIDDGGMLQIVNDTLIESSEGYKLTILKNRIRLGAKTPAGALYGLQSLMQLIDPAPNDKQKLILPDCEITDYPRFPYRGMHLDVSRHYFPVAFIKKYLDILTLYKINTFHWHLTDDQGWRIEMMKHPRLMEIGAWRKGTGTEAWNYFVELPDQDGEKYGGYYTQDEIRDIVAYASIRGITIIPEIELPGHSWAALAAYPELSCSGKIFKKPDHVAWEFSDPYCAGNDETFRFLEDVFDEVIALFPGEYIHIGGDEAKKTPWEKCPKCRKKMKELGLKNVEELQSYFIGRIEKYLNAKGRKIIGWDEILQGGLAPNATVMSWRGESGGMEAAASGHYAIMTPGEYLYFNRYQDPAEIDYQAEGSCLPLEAVYHYEPVPASLPAAYHNYILGAQANVWTENLKTPGQVENMILPRLCALAELTWSSSSDKNYGDFLRRLGSQYRLWDQMKINYHIPYVTGIDRELKFINTLTLEMTNPIHTGRIYYTLDNSDPDIRSFLYNGKLELTENTTVKARIILPSGKTGPVTKGICRKVKPSPALTDFNKLTKSIEYTYYEAKLDSVGGMNRLRAVKSGTIDAIKIPDWVREDFWAIEYNGYLKIDSTAVYKFFTDSDDGSRLFIDHSLIIDNDSIHGVQTRTGQIALEKGFHPIKIQFFEAAFEQHLEAGMMGKDNQKITLDDKIYHESDDEQFLLNK